MCMGRSITIVARVIVAAAAATRTLRRINDSISGGTYIPFFLSPHFLYVYQHTADSYAAPKPIDITHTHKKKDFEFWVREK